MIGEGEGLVSDRVWDYIPSYSPMDAVWGHAPAPNELHAALRQMSLGKAVGEDEVTAELLKFGGPLVWDSVVRVCRAQWLLLIDAALGAEVVWPSEWCIGLVVPLWKRKGNKKDKNTWRGDHLVMSWVEVVGSGGCNSSSFLVRRSLRIASIWVSSR